VEAIKARYTRLRTSHAHALMPSPTDYTRSPVASTVRRTNRDVDTAALALFLLASVHHSRNAEPPRIEEAADTIPDFPDPGTPVNEPLSYGWATPGEEFLPPTPSGERARSVGQKHDSSVASTGISARLDAASHPSSSSEKTRRRPAEVETSSHSSRSSSTRSHARSPQRPVYIPTPILNPVDEERPLPSLPEPAHTHDNADRSPSIYVRRTYAQREHSSRLALETAPLSDGFGRMPSRPFPGVGAGGRAETLGAVDITLEPVEPNQQSEEPRRAGWYGDQAMREASGDALRRRRDSVRRSSDDDQARAGERGGGRQDYDVRRSRPLGNRRGSGSQRKRRNGEGDLEGGRSDDAESSVSSKKVARVPSSFRMQP
jgi:hypothetical protein